jgi:2-oxo-4-hydroxy-4-carboxy-5-ureidoimidazoline decarboxylase
VTVGELDRVPVAEARELLTACCGAAPWVDAMLAARPFGDRDGLLDAADQAWTGLSDAQLQAAIARHPRLGESRARAALSAREQAWSAGEQSGVGHADHDARAALARGNEDYERRFGHTFILCATGLGPAEMLAALRQRLANDERTEREITARELHRITRLRLEKLLAAGHPPAGRVGT